MPIQRKKPSVEITLPVYNEEKELEKNVYTVVAFCKENMSEYNWHITIADNASNDRTPDIAKTIAKKYKEVSHFRLDQKGRGRAVKEVWRNSECDYCSYMDIDLSTDLKHLPRIIKELENGYDIAIGTRLKKGALVEGRTLLREITSRALNYLFIQMVFGTHFSDAQCGFKAVSRSVVTDLIPYIVDNGWFFDGELLIVGEKSGYKIYEEPVHWIDNPGSTVQLLKTITGDLESMYRLLRTRPWVKLKKEKNKSL
ncbi:MAG TPA: glycosyltransferase [Patescibacteria group bacterium]|nr:glycosyltransferase [Patescibacteria group bacterium]